MAAKYTTTPIACRAIPTMPTTSSRRSCCASAAGLAEYQPGSFEGWLWRITRNAFLDEVRRRRRRPSVPFPDDSDQVLAGFRSPSPEEILADLRLDDDIQKALSDLPYEFREAVVMCDVIGLSYEEISQARGDSRWDRSQPDPSGPQTC